MDLDDARHWLEALEANLLDADYRVYTDSNTHFKIAAIRRVLERNDELETALSGMDGIIDEIRKVIGPVL